MKIAVLNGPNLNLLGSREPAIYGTDSLATIESRLVTALSDRGVELRFEQTNHEGLLVDQIQAAADGWECDGIVLNPGALAHYSIAVRDAVESISIPVVEVHLTNTAAREEFRWRSVVAGAAVGKIEGLGWHGYLLAVEFLLQSRDSS